MAPSWRSWLANEGSKHLFLFFWLSLNVWFFWKTFLLYYQGPQYYYLHQMLGLGLCVSRASASVLNLNCCLVLLPMCRVLLAFLRGSQKVASKKTRRLLDKSKTFHVTCGVTICVFSVLHVAAHLVNALNFSENFNEDFLALNAANYRGEDPRNLLFATVPGLTGVIMVLVLFLMCTASTYAIRVSNYDIFWYTHNLFFVFYMLLMLHVSGGVLKYQTNLKEHPPGCFNPNKTLRENMTVPKAFEETFPDYTTEPFPEDLSVPEPFVQNNFMSICSEEPTFQSHFPETWFWISGPLCLYCVERLYRYIRSNKPVTITSVISHPSNVLEVRMVKDDFKARPGQYVILHCPRVSALESHPFTLTMKDFGIYCFYIQIKIQRFCPSFSRGAIPNPNSFPWNSRICAYSQRRCLAGRGFLEYTCTLFWICWHECVKETCFAFLIDKERNAGSFHGPCVYLSIFGWSWLSQGANTYSGTWRLYRGLNLQRLWLVKPHGT
ncbi:NADPH oxidase 4 isoform X4 [Patagioenas fasciata]|uniref:NADPH oxidase 4 isoform X4 n=1 Tax=Patagioenas fasciata TaxID=372321 RepID=UPI003A99CF9D